MHYAFWWCMMMSWTQGVARVKTVLWHYSMRNNHVIGRLMLSWISMLILWMDWHCVCCGNNMVVEGEDLVGTGFHLGNFQGVFWTGGGRRTGCLASWAKWSPTFMNFSLWYWPLKDSGSFTLGHLGLGAWATRDKILKALLLDLWPWNTSTLCWAMHLFTIYT